MNYTIDELKLTYSRHFSSCDVIYLSSSLGLLGSISNSTNIKCGQDLAGLHLDIIFDVLLPSQTLIIPGFSYSFSYSSEEPSLFSLLETPPSIGDMPLRVFRSGLFLRSIDPFLSVFALGPAAPELIGDIPFTSYGFGSIFERLRGFSTRVVSVGLGNHWLPFLHHADFLSSTPFRYPKSFSGDIITPACEYLNTTWTYDVRLPVPNTYPDTRRLADICTTSADSLTTLIGRSSIFSYNYSIALDVSLPIVQNQPWISVVGPSLSPSEIQYIRNDDISRV